MAEIGAVSSESKDEEITSTELSLHEWRYMLLHADGWLRWEQTNQPLILAAAVTIFFTVLWYMEPSVLTTVSLLVMLVCLADYLGPTLFHSYLCPPTEWTAEHQRQYQQVCTNLLSTKYTVVTGYQWLRNMKEEKPKQYIILAIVVLAVTAFIGNLVPNVCLAYFLALFLVLLPGLQQRGLLSQIHTASLQMVLDFLKKTKKKD